MNKEDGNGYGLYLVKQIVDKGHGQIQISSRVDEGTSFIITFPLQEEGELIGS